MSLGERSRVDGRSVRGMSGMLIWPPVPINTSSGLMPRNSIMAPMIRSVVMLIPPPPIGIWMPPPGKPEATATLAAAIFDVVALAIVLVVAHGGPSIDERVTVQMARPTTAHPQRQRASYCTGKWPRQALSKARLRDTSGPSFGSRPARLFRL